MDQFLAFLSAHGVTILAIAATPASAAVMLFTAYVRTAPERRPTTADDKYAWRRSAWQLFLNMESASGKFPSLPAADPSAQQVTK